MKPVSNTMLFPYKNSTRASVQIHMRAYAFIPRSVKEGGWEEVWYCKYT